MVRVHTKSKGSFGVKYFDLFPTAHSSRERPSRDYPNRIVFTKRHGGHIGVQKRACGLILFLL